MPRIKYDQMAVTPYEYWDLRLRHFAVFKTDERVTDALYDTVKRELLLDLSEFLTEQEGGQTYGVETTPE